MQTVSDAFPMSSAATTPLRGEHLQPPWSRSRPASSSSRRGLQPERVLCSAHRSAPICTPLPINAEGFTTTHIGSARVLFNHPTSLNVMLE
jgi:hypothetical protein